MKQKHDKATDYVSVARHLKAKREGRSGHRAGVMEAVETITRAKKC
jgi:hypothetical protein